MGGKEIARPFGRTGRTWGANRPPHQQKSGKEHPNSLDYKDWQDYGVEGFRQTPAKRSSKEENVGDLGTGGVALHQDLVLTGGADRIGDDGILLVVDERGQLASEVGEASGIEIELEDAFLDASAIEFTAFGDAAQPAFVSDVVGDDAKHGWWFLVWLWHEEEFGDVSVSEELA